MAIYVRIYTLRSFSIKAVSLLEEVEKDSSVFIARTLSIIPWKFVYEWKRNELKGKGYELDWGANINHAYFFLSVNNYPQSACACFFFFGIVIFSCSEVYATSCFKVNSPNKLCFLLPSAWPNTVWSKLFKKKQALTIFRSFSHASFTYFWLTDARTSLVCVPWERPVSYRTESTRACTVRSSWKQFYC